MCISPCHVSGVHAKACMQPIAIGLCNALVHLYVICLLCAHVPEYIQSLQARQPTCVRSELTASHQRHAAKCRAIKALEERLAVTEAGLANALVQHRMQVRQPGSSNVCRKANAVCLVCNDISRCVVSTWSTIVHSRRHVLLETCHHPRTRRSKMSSPVRPARWHPPEAPMQSCEFRSSPTTPASRYMLTCASPCVQSNALLLR